MNIEKTVNGNETVLALSGCLDTPASAEFAAALASVETAETLVIDFTALEFIASSALRSLVAFNKRAVAAGRKLILAGMNDVVADVFDVTGLSEVFTIR